MVCLNAAISHCAPVIIVGSLNDLLAKYNVTRHLAVSFSRLTIVAPQPEARDHNKTLVMVELIIIASASARDKHIIRGALPRGGTAL